MNPTSLTNERLCALAQKGDGAARELLVEKNMGFIVQTADIVYRSSSLEGSDLNIDVDDLVQEGSIGLLMNDRALYDSLAEASANLSSLLEDLQNNPKRYVHFSLFGGGKNK